MSVSNVSLTSGCQVVSPGLTCPTVEAMMSMERRDDEDRGMAMEREEKKKERRRKSAGFKSESEMRREDEEETKTKRIGWRGRGVRGSSDSRKWQQNHRYNTSPLQTPAPRPYRGSSQHLETPHLRIQPLYSVHTPPYWTVVSDSQTGMFVGSANQPGRFPTKTVKLSVPVPGSE